MSYAKQLQSINGVNGWFLHCPTCYNGKVYAISYLYLIQVDIVVKGKEVVISLLPFVEVPNTCYNPCPYINSVSNYHSFLKEFSTQLFYIEVCLNYGMTTDDVYLFKLDFISMTWEAMLDLKDAIFFLELASNYSACYYDSTVNSELGGHVHILCESGKTVYSFNVKDRTMSISPMPCLVQESHSSTWAMLEWRFEVDCVESYQKEKEDKDIEIIVRAAKDDKTAFDITTDIVI